MRSQKCMKCGEKTFQVDFIVPFTQRYYDKLNSTQQAAVEHAHLMGNSKHWDDVPLMGYCMLCDYLVVYRRQWSYSIEHKVQSKTLEEKLADIPLGNDVHATLRQGLQVLMENAGIIPVIIPNNPSKEKSK